MNWEWHRCSLSVLARTQGGFDGVFFYLGVVGALGGHQLNDRQLHLTSSTASIWNQRSVGNYTRVLVFRNLLFFGFFGFCSACAPFITNTSRVRPLVGEVRLQIDQNSCMFYTPKKGTTSIWICVPH